MEVKQVISGGKLKGSYMSSWNSQLQLTVEGGHEINVKIPEEELRDLAKSLNERIEEIDTERANAVAEAAEVAALETAAKADAKEEFND